jgi:hypothetical protein
MAKTSEADRSVLGSGDPEYQEEAKAAAMEAVGEEEYNANPDLYWTAQQGGMPDTGRVAALGPQRYLPEQLPDPDVARASNIAPQNIPEGLTISDEEAWEHPKGPEPGEQVRLLKNEAVNQRMLTDASEATADRESFVLTSSGLANVRAAQEAENPDYPAGDDDLESLSKAELVDRAREAGIEGYSTMNKAELIEALEAE